MIKFTCDSCGKDISEKVHCSIRQFYPIDHFKKEISERVGWTHDLDERATAQHHAHRVYLDVCLFDEFSRVMHARAWDISSARILCSKCAVKNGRRKDGKVVTIFTKVEGASYGESSSADGPLL